MQDTFLKSYWVDFQTVSPVFIGSGNTIGKKEYLYNWKRNEISILDLQKLFHGMQKRRLLGEYEDYLLNEKFADLAEFFRSKNLYEQDYAAWIKYTIPMAGSEKLGRKNRNILTCTRDSYQNPYVPGSSLKGALRTALLAEKIDKGKERYREDSTHLLSDLNEYAKPRQYLKRNAKSLEVRAFHVESSDERIQKSDAVNDTMKGLRISDSLPLKNSDMCICAKIDMDLKGEVHALPIYRECIKPGVTLSFQITIDSRYFRHTISEVLGVIRPTYVQYRDTYLSKFYKVPPVKDSQNILFLGGGAGYPTKTVTYHLLNGDTGVKTVAKILDKTAPKQRTRNGRRPASRISSEVAQGVSPHVVKLTEYDGDLYQMGACKIKGYIPVKA